MKKGGPRFSRVVPVLLLAACSLYAVSNLFGAHSTNAIHVGTVISNNRDIVPSVTHEAGDAASGVSLAVTIAPVPDDSVVEEPEDVQEAEFPDAAQKPSASTAGDSTATVHSVASPKETTNAQPSSKPLRFYVHKPSKKFEAEALVKKHKKCEGFQWSNDLKFLRHVRDGKVTEDPSKADFFLVPFLSKCWFNFEAKYHLDKMERDFNLLADELEATTAWKKFPDKHIFIFSSGVGPTLVPSWRRVRKGIFILAEGDRSAGFYESSRDIVIPGVGKATKGQVSSMDLHRPRSLLATFRGTLVRGHARNSEGKSVFCRSLLRQALLNLAKNRKDVAINDRRYTDNQGTLDKKSYKKELTDSTFCIIPRGLTPWTSRLFDAIALDCIPVILSNAIVFPYERSIDYSQFTIKLPESWVGKLWSVLENIPRDEVRALQMRVRKAAPLFLGKGPIDAVVGELSKLRSGGFGTGGTKNSMNTFWAPGRGVFELSGNEAKQVGPSYSAGAEPHPAASELWVPDDSFKKLVGNLWKEENCVPCSKCKFGQWFLQA